MNRKAYYDTTCLFFPLNVSLRKHKSPGQKLCFQKAAIQAKDPN